ncbi:hypothetical protein PIB30_087040 [Stylosanthes scabra]|uniref:Uncharacterized protein n=1 Tax=Stylosanthes scabra TaxID=79078 RepID=A0ABU6SU68_9FABA|nr:hypothetical protein [Stylosanthes scabra]
MRGEDLRAEDIIADNMAVIAQELQGKGNLSFPSTIYKLCKDATVPLREFKRTSKITKKKLITAKRMESTRIPTNESFYEKMQKSQAEYIEEVKAIRTKQEELWNNTNRFHSQIRKEQEMLAREIQEVRKGQINQTLINNQRAEAEKNMEQAVERQARDISEMRKQLNLWTRNASAREAYSCWAHLQANPNLSEIPVNHISDLMQTNAERGRPMFYGALKSHQGASSSSQPDQEEPVPLRNAPPLPSF